jgi:hypothetical protein
MITYQIANREYLAGGLPLESLYAWADEHDAKESLLRVLNGTLFRWGNPDISLVVYFCGPTDTYKRFSHDAASEELEQGDVVFNKSLVDKQRDYRMDQVRVYKWIQSRNEWRLHKDRVIYYARTFPFRAYTKKMSAEWGVARESMYRGSSERHERRTVACAVKSSFLLSFLESVPDVSAKLKEPVTADRKFEDVVKSAEQAAVLVLVY